MKNYNAKKNIFLSIFLICFGCISEDKNDNPLKEIAENLTRDDVVYSSGAVLGSLTRNFNPFSTSALSETLGLIYEPLFRINSITSAIEPWLSESFSLSPDLKKLSIQIKDGLKWSDGHPFTVNDVEFTLNIIRDNPSCDLKGIWEHIDDFSIDKENATITINLSEPHVMAAHLFTSPLVMVPRHIWSKVARPCLHRNENPIGTGPYILYGPWFKQQDYTLIYNPFYPNKPKAVKALKIIAFTSNATAQEGLSSGNLDWGTVAIPNIKKLFIDANPSKHDYWFSMGNPVFWVFNFEKNKFRNKAFRKGLSAAINRQRLVRVALGNHASIAPATGLKPGIYDPYKIAGSPSFSLPDIEKAKIFFREAGFTYQNDGRLYDKKGSPLKINIMVPASFDDWITACRLLQEDLKAVGIELKLRHVQWAEMQEGLMAGNFMSALAPVPFRGHAYFFYENFYHSSMVNRHNQSRIRDKFIDNQLDIYRKKVSLSNQERSIWLSSLAKYVEENVLNIPLWFNPVWFSFNKTRFEGWPSEDNPYARPRPRTVDIGIILRNLRPGGAHSNKQNS